MKEKIIPEGLCIKCGKLTPAICGVFDLLCPDCLEEKRQTKPKSFFNDRD